MMGKDKGWTRRTGLFDPFLRTQEHKLNLNQLFAPWFMSTSPSLSSRFSNLPGGERAPITFNDLHTEAFNDFPLLRPIREEWHDDKLRFLSKWANLAKWTNHDDWSMRMIRRGVFLEWTNCSLMATPATASGHEVGGKWLQFTLDKVSCHVMPSGTSLHLTTGREDNLRITQMLMKRFPLHLNACQVGQFLINCYTIWFGTV